MKMKLILFVVTISFVGQVFQCDEGVQESTSYVVHHCDHKLRQLDSIIHFNEFIRHFKVMIKSNPKPKRGLFKQESRLLKCYNLADALLELEVLLQERYEGVCRVSYIEKLVKFHSRHLSKDGVNKELPQFIATRKTYIAYFFSLYLNQIAFTCKSRLIERVKSAQSEHDCSHILAQFLPESYFNNVAGQEMDDVTKFLREFRRIELFSPIRGSPSHNDLEPYFDVKVPYHVVENIELLKSDCRKRQPYHLALFSPISALSQLGYTVDEPSCDSNDLDDSNVRILKCWLATAQLCQGILRTHLAAKDDADTDGAEAGEKLMTVRWGSLPPDVIASDSLPEEVQFVDTVEEISPEIKDHVDKQFLEMRRLKQRAVNLARRVLIRHIDLETIERVAAKKFMDALISSDLQDDSSVVSGFGGKEFSATKYNPTSVITNDADFIVTSTSSFWGPKLALVMSSIVAIVMSAVFVWFSLYAAVTAVKQHKFTDDGDHGKSQWRKLRDEKVAKFAAIYNKDSKGIGGYQPR